MNHVHRLEQERLDSILKKIKEQIGKLKDESSRQRKEVINIRRHFWDDVKVNTDTFDDYLETIIGLRQQAQGLSVNQGIHRHAMNRLSVLQRMYKAPYFGRITFIEEGAREAENIYIGISTLTDTSGENFLIYDWRAPISSIFYDFPPGQVKYDTPGGIVHGILEEKWQYMIDNGVIESMFDTTLTIRDEILQRALGKGTDKHMHNIVATIQQEQNRIIRHENGRLLIVQGAAGSGKTSAALQRIAYLLYKHRSWLKADQIILFSPNAMFNNYVSRVLPELGEENMQQVTFQEYLDHRLSHNFQVENPYEQLEYVLTEADSPSYSTRLACIRFKASIYFFEMINKYHQSLEESGMIFKGIKFRGRALVSAHEISERFYQNENSLRFQNRIEKLKEWLDGEINKAEKLELNKQWVQEEMELLSKEDYQKAYTYLQKKRDQMENTFDDDERERKILALMIVRRKLKPIREWVQALRFIDFTKIYQQIFTEPARIKQWSKEKAPENWEEVCQMTVKMLADGQLLYEDATPFLFLQELIQGFQTNYAIKHVLIDEAQDYSPFQIEFLKRLFPSAKTTMLGDFNQAIFPHANEMTDFQMLAGIYGPEETKMINLTRSYRSTRPIVEFTRMLIPSGERIIAFDRNGEKPLLTQLSDRAELHRYIISKVEELRKQQYHTIAIVCKSASESRVAYEGLHKIEDCKLVTSDSIEYEQGIVVIPAYLAKGIEFDAVIIYDASAEVYNDESERRLFYTACTRAMHYLQLYSVGEPTPFLQISDSEKIRKAKI